ncbi:hypothetical protein [Cylindrospermum sp. FACHB-282]|uniref:hypothetical protein n=1 Tax=Cylindrospermum sp. FACHB-282 TaxID=2692794 RepID=UPI001689C095|nr:hypothetical protein [Cylindrospermum sp. FACHB-282]MBD2385372.1 hypothetical protein [Cylindrospermum sp. FACHB-282]
MPRNIRWDESVLENALILVEALMQLSEQQPENLQPKPPLYVQWEADKLRVTGYETKSTGKIARTVEVGTKKDNLLKLVTTVRKTLKLPQRQKESGSSQPERELQEVQNACKLPLIAIAYSVNPSTSSASTLTSLLTPITQHLKFILKSSKLAVPSAKMAHQRQ